MRCMEGGERWAQGALTCVFRDGSGFVGTVFPPERPEFPSFLVPAPRGAVWGSSHGCQHMRLNGTYWED